MARIPSRLMCGCQWDGHVLKRCDRHQVPHKKPPVRPIYYTPKAEIVLEMGEKIEDPLAQALYFFCYLTGCRISEATDFTPSRLKMLDDFAQIELRTLKKRSTGPSYRKVLIPLGKYARCFEDKMFPHLSSFLNGLDQFKPPFKRWTNMSTYLGRAIELTTEAKKKNTLSGEWADGLVIKPLHPHYLRHCRATHMIEYYDLNLMELCEMFGWNDTKTPKRYMGIKTLREALIKGR